MSSPDVQNETGKPRLSTHAAIFPVYHLQQIKKKEERKKKITAVPCKKGTLNQSQ